MTKIAPFKALRPVRDKVHLVATRPYYSYKKNVLKAKLEDNPFTFLRIINPEFGTSVKTKPNSVERFNLVSEKYAEFIEEGILIKDQEAHLYVYRQKKDGHEFTGIVAGASVQEYEDDFIKKHEATLTSREAMFTNYLDIVGYNAEPVLLSYPHEQAIDDLLVKYTAARPEYEFTTTDRIKHELWVLSVEDSASMIKAFEKLPAAYIADGHHRSASSAGLKKHRQSKGTSQFPNEDYFLAYFIDENRLKILEFNRLVKTLNNLTKEEFLQKLEDSFVISALNGSSKPSHEHQMTMCLEGKWFELNCKPSIIDENHPVKCLDAEILTQAVLRPILGIHDLKTDENIEFISGAETIESFEDKIVKGKFKVGFVLYPASMDQVKKVADAQLIMPPKSTWVEPKMRSGLTIYNINE
ncbi:MAG: DUF1015 domain-containing protein [Crocinitomicaceae bacterium]|nr:DUF1015 domain-containing protein [Crocinitomicaceae bacterium]